MAYDPVPRYHDHPYREPRRWSEWAMGIMAVAGIVVLVMLVTLW